VFGNGIVVLGEGRKFARVHHREQSQFTEGDRQPVSSVTSIAPIVLKLRSVLVESIIKNPPQWPVSFAVP